MVQDMTTGSPTKKILLFTIPLLIGSLFQQFYNMADSIIVGKMLGANALGAVGSTGPITFLVLGLALGSCSGFAIPVAQDFGAGNEAGVRRCVANIIYVGAAMALILTIITTLLTDSILHLLNTPEELMSDARDYLFWVFLGSGALILYNLLAGILRSLGDSRTPLIYLVVASILNIILDLLFVGPFKMGTAGAAIATVLAQLISGLACLFHIRKKMPILHLSRTDMRPHKLTIQRLIGFGLPMGLQFSITAVGSIIMQAAVNALGTVIVTAVSVSSKIFNMASAPLESFGVTAATYAGQNYGARNLARVRDGIRRMLIMMFIFAALFFSLVCVFSDQVSLLFISSTEKEILTKVHQHILVNSLASPLLVLIFIYRNTLQGLGFSKAAMLAGAAELVGRVIVAMLIVPGMGFMGVCLSNFMAWVLADMLLVPLYIILFKKLSFRMGGIPAKTA